MQRTSVFDGLIAKTVHFFSRENSRPQMGKNRTSAFRSEIESQISFGVREVRHRMKRCGRFWLPVAS